MASLNRLAFSATLHCLTGCAIGEILGLVIATALGWGNAASIAIAVVLAFIFGYSFTLVPLLRGGIAFATAVGLALASDTLSIAVMEIVDNTIVLIWPGAMDAGLDRHPLLGQPRDRPRHCLRRRLPGQPGADRTRARACRRARLSRALREL